MNIDKTASGPANTATLFLYLLLLAAFVVLGSASPLSTAMAQETDEVWLLIDTSTLTLSIMQGERIVQTYQNIAIGSNGPTREKRVMDEKTPLGDFRINAVRPSQRFHLFLSIDYPNIDDVRRAMKDNRISFEEYQALVEAWSKGEQPPQETSLGGYLGIHGVGAGDEAVHNQFNWTNGCIAVTNEQVEELAGLVAPGTRVLIR
jgi:murein L,D-transpeptidase YafK